MFAACQALSTITISDSVTTIQSYAFSACSGLTSITIPSKVTLVNSQAFNSCLQLAEIIFEGEKPTFGTDVFRLIPNIDLYFPCTLDSWKNYMDEAPSNVNVASEALMVSFNNDNTIVEEIICSGKGATIAEPSAPVKADYIFGGWYKDYYFANLFDFSTPITEDLMLYAKWTKKGAIDTVGMLRDSIVELVADTLRLHGDNEALIADTLRLHELLALCENSSDQELLDIIEGLKNDTINLNHTIVGLITDTLRLHGDNEALTITNEALKVDTAKLYDTITVRDGVIAGLRDQLELCQSGDDSELYDRIAALEADTLRLSNENTVLTDVNHDLKIDTADLNAEIAHLQDLLANCGNSEDLQYLQDSIDWLNLLLAECGNPNISLEPASESDVRIYPNPVVDILNVEILGNIGDYSDIVEFYDTTGARVYLARIPNGATQFTIDMTTFSAGLYILRIGNRMAKIVKN
jgi:uncharacterized repeat protein (TIGR02543 family)